MRGGKKTTLAAGSRRSFFKWMSLLTAVWPTAGSSRSAYDYPQPEQVGLPGPAERPGWCREGIVAAYVMVGYYPYVVRQELPQRGVRTDYDRIWKEDSNEASIRHYKDMGINLLIVDVSRGAGLKAEAETIEAAREATETAHRYGLRVCGYIGGTLYTETLYGEVPEAPSWEQIDERGRPIYYDHMTHRHAACRNNPGYRAFIQKLVRLGIVDLKLDMLTFDHLDWWPEPWSCHCQYCQEGLRSFLRKRYTGAQLRSRFGFTNLEGIRVPDFNLDAPPVPWPQDLSDPLRQEWAQFRCACLAEWWAQTRAYIRQLNPEVALLGNPTMYPGLNHGFQNGVDLQQMLPHCEYIWTEEGNEPLWTSDQCLVSRIHSYKRARAMGRSLFIWQRVKDPRGGYDPPYAEGPLTLCVAESLAYNDANLGVWEVMYLGRELPPRYLQYLSFFHSHIQDLRDTRLVSDVAILRSFASMEFNPAKSNVSTVLFAQTLIQCKLPFGIIFDVHLKDLSPYKVLVLANQDALSEEQLAQIRRFVEAGGGLVATEDTSALTEWRRKRSKFGLAELLGIEAPPDAEKAKNPLRREFGKGRAVYIPRIEPAVEPPPAMMSYEFSDKYWKLPKNYEDLVEAVEWAGREHFSAKVDTPLWVTMELAEQESTGTWLLHLLNFRFEEALKDIPVSVRVPEGRRLREAVLETPDGIPRQVLEVTGREGVISFNVPELRMYDLILLRMERK